jgi:hypothetical protein
VIIRLAGEAKPNETRRLHLGVGAVERPHMPATLRDEHGLTFRLFSLDRVVLSPSC